MKADGALAGLVGLEFVFVGFHGGSAGVEGTVFRPRAKGHKQLSAKTEAWELVADALFSLGRRGLDGSSKLFERGSLLVAQECKVLIEIGPNQPPQTSAVRNGCRSDGKQKCAAVADATDLVLLPFPECRATVPLSIHLVFEDRGNSVQP